VASKTAACINTNVGGNGSYDMTSFKSLILLTIISIQLMGQTTDPLTGNDWIVKQLKLGDLKTTDSEIELRIFLDVGITNGGQVIQIVKRNSTWTGTKYNYFLKMKKGTVTDKIAKTTKTELKSDNWDSLWIKLENLDITTLPNQDDIKDKLRKEVTTKRGKGYEVLMVNDGSSYDLTIKKGENMFSYSFHSPWTYSQKYPDVEEVRKYSDIILTLENEFQIKFRH
jgi:hypothetical protein